jgi:ankyrin repeat protein
MSCAILKKCGLALMVILVAALLGACAVSNAQRASHELKQMKAERYFANPVQAGFVTAIGRGELEQAQRLLTEGATVDAVGSEGMTALHWAIAKRNFEGFRFLLTQGANPRTLTRWRDANGQEQWAGVIDFASALEDGRYLRALLDAGGDPNQIINSSEQTAIYIAILNRRYENASLLLERGADINHRSKSLTTPINRAVSGSAYRSAAFLLKAGANPSIKDRWGYSAVDTAKKFGKAGMLIGSDDDAAYDEFVAELKRRGFWGE